MITETDQRIIDYVRFTREAIFRVSLELRQMRRGITEATPEALGYLIAALEGRHFSEHDQQGVMDLLEGLEVDLEGNYDIPFTAYDEEGADDEPDPEDEESEDEEEFDEVQA